MANYSRKSSGRKSQSNNKTNRNAYFAQKAEKEVKKLPNIAKILMVFFFLIGTAAAFFACKFMCKDDCFEINGKKSFSLMAGEEYRDEGVKVIGFGQDLTSKVKIEVYKDSTKLESLSDIDTSAEAVYQIVYTVDSFRFRDVKLIRTVTVVSTETEDYEEEEDSYNPDAEGTSFYLNYAY